MWGCCDGIALFGVFGLGRFVVWFACGLCSLWGLGLRVLCCVLIAVGWFSVAGV